jgi:hypothetical protein
MPGAVFPVPRPRGIRRLTRRDEGGVARSHMSEEQRGERANAAGPEGLAL